MWVGKSEFLMGLPRTALHATPHASLTQCCPHRDHRPDGDRVGLFRWRVIPPVVLLIPLHASAASPHGR